MIHSRHEKLNHDKREAIYVKAESCLINAGPGSGKTHALIERIFYLIHIQKLKPSELLVATFSRKAIKEIKERLEEVFQAENIPFNINELHIGTLHSLFHDFLKEHIDAVNLPKNTRLMNDWEQKYFIYQNLDRFQAVTYHEVYFSERQNPNKWDHAVSLSRWLNTINDEYIDYKKMHEDEDPRIRALSELYILYRELLRKHQLIDYSTIQVVLMEIFNQSPEIMHSYRERFKHLIIDEYQDSATRC